MKSSFVIKKVDALPETRRSGQYEELLKECKRLVNGGVYPSEVLCIDTSDSKAAGRVTSALRHYNYYEFKGDVALEIHKRGAAVYFRAVQRRGKR